MGVLNDLKDHRKVCAMTGNTGCVSDHLAARAVTEIERLRVALEQILERHEINRDDCTNSRGYQTYRDARRALGASLAERG